MHKVTNTNLEHLSSSLFHHSIKLQPLKGDDIKLLQFKEEEIKENRIIQNEEKANSESQLIEDIIKYQENIIKKNFKYLLIQIVSLNFLLKNILQMMKMNVNY